MGIMSDRDRTYFCRSVIEVVIGCFISVSSVDGNEAGRVSLYRFINILDIYITLVSIT